MHINVISKLMGQLFVSLIDIEQHKAPEVLYTHVLTETWNSVLCDASIIIEIYIHKLSVPHKSRWALLIVLCFREHNLQAYYW